MAMAFLREKIEASSMPVTECGCWIWLGSLNDSGYGQVWNSGRNSQGAHRASWKAFRGEIPPGLHVLHSCDVRACVNPDHLWLGTHLENMGDRAAKFRNGIRHPKKPPTGAAYLKSAKKWKASMNVYIGLFDTKEEATAAYLAFKKKLVIWHPQQPTEWETIHA